MKELILKGGEIAFVDDEDYERCLSYSWYIHHKSKNVFYVAGILKKKRSPTISYYLHHFIMGVERGQRQRVDHKNGNNLDNRKENLRFCTHTQNNQNVKMSSRNKSGYKGICFTKRDGWKAVIGADGEKFSSEYFQTKEEAAIAYDKLAILHHGEFARTNFPLENYL